MTQFRSTLFWRFVLAMLSVSVLAIGTSAAFLYIRFAKMDTRFHDGTLRSFSRSLLQAVPLGGDLTHVAIPTSLSDKIAAAGGRFAIVSPSGVIASSTGVSAALIPFEDVKERYFTLPATDNAEPTYGLSVRVKGTSPSVFVQVAFPANHVLFDSVLEEFLPDVAWIWLPFVLCILATNIIVARIALKPLRKAARQAETIGPGSVTTRLEEARLPREVLILVRSVNYAFDRLQQGYQMLEEFVADVAHELRTPLAVIKAQLAVSDAPVDRALSDDFGKMERLVQQLLDRVRLGGLRFEAEELVDLGKVARDVARFLAPLIIAQNRSIEVLGADTPVCINGAGDYIFRAVRNLIENAVEHAPRHTTVTVIVSDDRSIAVLDCGPGFATQAFASEGCRRGELRSDRAGGVGLGLSIVERTMTAHHGRLELSNRECGGASAVMRFFPPPGRKNTPAATRINPKSVSDT